MDEGLGVAKKRLFNTITALLGVLSVFVVVLVVLSVKWYQLAESSPYESNTITVSGEAEEFVVPDVAVLSFTLEEVADTIPQAQERADKKMKQALEFFDDKDIDEEDIKTTYFNISPKYEWYYANPAGLRCSVDYCPPPYQRKQEQVGFEVRQSTQIKVRDIDEAGTILAGLGEIGFQNISGLSFVVDEEDEIREEVKNEAIKVAKDKAKDRAKALGVRLGDLVAFHEDGYYPEPYFARDMMAMEMADAIGAPTAIKIDPPAGLSPGESRITASVTITYEIK